jgi:hypothetical protein
MLGTVDSRHPWIFNLGAVLTGVAGVLGAFGLFLALRTVTWTALALLVGLAVVANGVLSLKAGMPPMPRFAACVVAISDVPNSCRPGASAVCLVAAKDGLADISSVQCSRAVIDGSLDDASDGPVFAEGTMQRLLALVVLVPVGVAGYALVGRARGSLSRAGNKRCVLALPVSQVTSAFRCAPPPDQRVARGQLGTRRTSVTRSPIGEITRA